MARPCSICTHAERAAVDAALLAGEAFRHIAARFSISTGALQRHKTDHLPLVLAAGAAAGEAAQPAHAGAIAAQGAARDSAEDAYAVDVFRELSRCIRRINLLSDACDEWLRDPEDRSRYNVGPRAEDVLVTYTTYRDGKTQKARLSELLRAVEKQARVERGETKYADPRDLMLKWAVALKGQLELLVSVYDRLYNGQQVALFQQAMLDAIAEAAPDVRDRVLDAVERRHPLRRVVGVPVRPVPSGDAAR